MGVELLEQLRESPARQQDLFDAAPLPYFVFGLHGEILELNLTAAGFLGRGRTQLVGTPFACVARLESRESFLAHLMECAASKDRVSAELRLTRESGGRAIVRLESVAARDAAGRPHSVRSMLLDVTGERLSETELERRLGAEQAVRRRQERLTAAHVEISDRIAFGAPLEEILQLAVEQVRTLLQAEFAAVGIIDHPDGPFQPWVQSGLSSDRAQAMARSSRPVGLLGEIVRGRKLIRTADVQQHTAFGGLPPYHPFITSFLGVPIEYRGRTVGNLCVANKHGESDFTLEDQQVLEALALRIGPALEITRTREREARDRERAKLLDDVSVALAETLDYELVMARIGELAVPRLADCCMIYVVEDGRWRCSAGFHANPDKEPLLEKLQADPRLGPANPASPAARAAATKQVVGIAERACEELVAANANLPEVESIIRQLAPRSYMAVPFVLDGKLLGLMAMANCETPRGFEERDAALARGVGQRAALAIENARLYRRLQEAVRSREDMLAVVAHDLRNPIQAIDLSAKMIAADVNGARVGRLISGIQSVSSRMKRLVDDLLDGAALDAGTVSLELELCRAGDLVDNAVSGFADTVAAQEIRLERDVEPGLPLVLCDGGRVEQVLTNLIGNAVKFTPGGGTIRIAARAAGRRLELSVSDAGKGIPREKIAHLFERYWKGEEGGTGLGLYIAKRIVDAHGGELWVESSPEGGSCFRFTLPPC
jgi:PAS domain S-box-containing protein